MPTSCTLCLKKQGPGVLSSKSGFKYIYPTRKLRIVSEKRGALLHPAIVSEPDLPQSIKLIIALKLSGEADKYLEQGVTKPSS